jgi:fatty acid desaturase
MLAPVSATIMCYLIPSFKVNEFSNRLSGIPEVDHCSNSEGMKYSNFRQSLKIKLGVIARNVTVAWAMIISSIIIASNVDDVVVSAILVIPLALWLSFWMQSYTSHFHEAAHFNIHPNRRVNDLLADLFLTPFVGLRVKDYRTSHWKHHRFLGLLDDTETSYVKPINVTQLVEGITGIYIWRTAIRYFKNYKNLDEKKARTENSSNVKSQSFILTLGLMLIFNVTIFFLFFTAEFYLVAFAWLCSVFITGPFIANIRQTLEHRSFTALTTIDYTKVEQGPCNRVFGTDFFSRNFGGSGFNRHLLHHVDPTVSYTCFDEMEAFLIDTPLKNFIEANRTTYFKTLLTLVKQ